MNTEDSEVHCIKPPEASEGYKILSFPAAELPQDYLPLIFSRWLLSLRYGNELFKKVVKKDYFEQYHRFIESLFAKPECRIHLAVMNSDESNVLGFSVLRGNVLDYVHVHKDHRHHGIGGDLIPQGVDTITHYTKHAAAILCKSPPTKEQEFQYRYWKLKFNPYA